MNELVNGYVEYLKNLKQIEKPTMPNIEPVAYTDNEYRRAIRALSDEYDRVDDLDITLKFLKGE